MGVGTDRPAQRCLVSRLAVHAAVLIAGRVNCVP